MTGRFWKGLGDESWRDPNFTIEMETGTGKTYVYLRTIYELSQRYGFRKFIIVVPSRAIYEGVIKTFEITRSHFASLYNNMTVNLVRYDGSQISRVRTFATLPFTDVMVMTLDSFNRKTNNLFKATEKLPGEWHPHQYIQAPRPIQNLDEPQNMERDRAKEALRTLHPLFALRYSATHRTAPNIIYRLTPFEAYRRNLVKKIQVYGVTERDALNRPFLSLTKVERSGGKIAATISTYRTEKGATRQAEWF
jgi:type III restriction enzyme